MTAHTMLELISLRKNINPRLAETLINARLSMMFGESGGVKLIWKPSSTNGQIYRAIPNNILTINSVELDGTFLTRLAGTVEVGSNSVTTSTP